MTYVFGTPTYLGPRTAPVPQFEVDTDGANIAVTHCKSGILSNMLSLAHIEKQCHGPFEDIAQLILRPIYSGKGKNVEDALVNCHAVVKFTDSALSAINRIAQHNSHMAPLYRVDKF